MAKILNIFRTIRNNWKKSLIGGAALSYGVTYSKEVYDTDQLMRQYCENVSQYGDLPLPTNIKPRHVTIILNPTAKKGKAKKLFQNYCEPLLHLAGIAVTVIQTGSQNDARKIIMDLDTSTDAIVVAGGDGTLSDVLTGLVRKHNLNPNLIKQYPVGILPLGETNKVAKSLYHEYDDLCDAKQIIEATMAIINEEFKMMDMIEIKPIEDNTEEPVKPIYAMGAVEWGAWKDANAFANKYWYWGPLRKYATYIFNGYKENLNQYCDAKLEYTLPCGGCSRCTQNSSLTGGFTNLNTRWWYVLFQYTWHLFVPRGTVTRDSIDFNKIINEKCDILHELPISTSELHIDTSNIYKSQIEPLSSLKVKMGPKNINYYSFVSEGWKKEKGNKSFCNQVIEAKNIKLIPQKVDKYSTLYIDNEEYELKAVEIKLLSRAVKVFCS